MKIKRGKIYLADLDPVIGAERGKIRPVLVIQNNKGNKYSETTIIACIKEKVRNNTCLPTQFVLPDGIGLKKQSVVMLEQIRVIEKSRIMKEIGALPEYCMKQIDKKIVLSLELTKNCSVLKSK